MEFTRTMRIAAPRAKVWDLLADTDRMNREVGLPPVAYELLPRGLGGAETFGTIALGRLKLRFQERPWEWVRPEFYTERRLFAQGPVTEFRVRMALTEEAGGTRIHCHAELLPRTPLAAPFVRAVGGKLMNDMERAWESFATYLTGRAATPYPKHTPQVPVVADRLARGVASLQSTEADPQIVRRLVDYLTQSPPEDVTTLRPFALADAWGFDRLAVLQTFLLASKAGLLELRWRLLCPSCRGASPENTARTLRDVRQNVHCPSCNIRFDAAFDQSVEVCFAVAPAVRPVQEALYCRGGPGLTPHVYAQWALEPGETRATELVAPPGRYVLVSPQAPASVSLRVAEADAAEATERPTARLERQDARGTLIVPETCLRRQAVWTLTNATEELVVLRLESLETSVPIVTAAQVTSMQAFRDQFSSEVLSPGTELAVRHICVLFSDLKGSTALYREQGDAPSYRMVRDHFQALRRIVSDHDGALVKTIGDAVMATFTDPAHGMAAALAIQKAARTWADRLTVKLGLHSGPAIAVNANDLLDYFGQTVNLASRLQSESEGGDIVIAAELTQDARIADLLKEKGCCVERFTHVVRGFETPLAMARITLPADSIPTP